MKPSDVSKLLSKTVGARLPVLLVGPPGVGKSALVGQAAADAKNDLFTSYPALEDPTDAKGFPWLSAEKDFAEFKPFGTLHNILKSKRPCVWFIDDIGQSTPAMQASYMHWLLARGQNGHRLPDHVTIIAATNRRTDKAGVQGILEPVKSRFCAIVNVEANLDDWCAWAIGTEQPPELIAFLRFRPDLLHQFNPTQDLVNQPCPRTWAHAGKLLALKLTIGLELEAIKGAVGDGAAAEFVAFLRIYRELPSLDGILLDPDGAKIPEQPASLYAVSVGLAAKATEANFSRIAVYADRLVRAKRGEFAVLMLRDSVRRNPRVTNTPAFIKLASTEVGKLITGGD